MIEIEVINSIVRCCISMRFADKSYPWIIFHDHFFLSHLSVPVSISLCLPIRVRSSLSANQKSPPPPLPPPKTPNQEVPPPLDLPAQRLTQKPRPCPQKAPQNGPSFTPWSPSHSRHHAPLPLRPPLYSPPFHASSTSRHHLSSSPRTSTRPLTPLPPLPLCRRSHRKARRCPPRWARLCTNSNTLPPPPLPPLPPRLLPPERTELPRCRWPRPPARGAVVGWLPRALLTGDPGSTHSRTTFWALRASTGANYKVNKEFKTHN